MRKKPIYVEINIDRPLDEVWQFTQQPDLQLFRTGKPLPLGLG